MIGKTIYIFGGTSGLGKSLHDRMIEDDPMHLNIIRPIGSNIVDLNRDGCGDIVQQLFEIYPPDIVLFFSNFTSNVFLHKQSNMDIEKQIKINLIGCTTVIGKALQFMRIRKYGRIIIASSIIEEISKPGTSVYAACKGYYETLVKNVALENAALGVTANCLKFGYMDGGLTYTHLDVTQQATALSQIPARRFGMIQEIYNATNFLVDTEYVNGATIRMAGGL